jgi:mannose-6-phosphate isomerase-like protein (cupin superfamily)
MSPSYVHFGSQDRFHPGEKVYREKKEWGEEQWIVNKEYCGKKLILRKNRRCSLHKHEKKDEVFYLLSGHVRMEVGDETFVLRPGDYVHIPAGVYHRFAGLEDSEIMEFSSNHQEEDSYRKEFSGHVEEERFARQKEIITRFTKIQQKHGPAFNTTHSTLIHRLAPSTTTTNTSRPTSKIPSTLPSPIIYRLESATTRPIFQSMESHTNTILF